MDTTAFLVITIVICVGLLISLCLLYSRHKSSSGDLTAERQRAEGLKSDLTAAQQQAEAERQHAEGLKSDLTAAQQQAEAERQHAEGLKSDLTAAQQQAEAEQQRAEGLKSDLTAAQQQAEAERQQAEGLKSNLDQARQHKTGLEKRISLLNCQLSVLEIKPNLEKLAEEIEAARKSSRWKNFVGTAAKAAMIVFSIADEFPGVDGFADPGLSFSNIGDSPDDFNVDRFSSERFDQFESLLSGFAGVSDLSDQELDSIPLENLKTYEAQLAKASQELDGALKGFSS